ncbi:myo-inositol 2-dehydrogenase [Fusarium longipes]|uniref:Myo-inositol 2-dehydrogenase n=1 Tax=Fusarium longipes TaxID=694270 RepID=A0A395SXG0_9HYPO|nr:myo-inositol 2-dehydrogenase [Fusarium longipes]
MPGSSSNRIVNVGIIGCGEISQVVHIPTLLFMSGWFQITYLCDISADALRHCAPKLDNAVETTQNASILCSSDKVDAVIIANADEYHASHTILALENDKHVLVEKPMVLTMRDALAVEAAEKASRGKVMVGYMRRYAAPFEDAVREIGGMDKILYARVRDIIGPNSYFVKQSGTFPQKFTDISDAQLQDKDARAQDMIKTALQDECGGIPVTTDSARMWRLFGGLGSHDLSLMREVLGMPQKVVGSSLGFPFWNVLFKYNNFTVSYESGLDNVPRFDAHLEVYSSDKTVRLQYDTPYVKGLPVTMHVIENVDGVYKESIARRSYEDPYTIEMKALWEMVVKGKPAKTTVQDAMQDLELFVMAIRYEYGAA